MHTPATDALPAPLELQPAQVEDSQAALALSDGPAAPGDDGLLPRELDQARDDEFTLSPALRVLPVQLDIRVPLASFRVRDLLALQSGAILGTNWPASDDVPLESAGLRLLWAEFEVADQKLAARITRLA